VPTLVADLQLVLIKQLLTDEHTDTGILSHPLLSLILASESAFESVTAAFVARQPPASQSTVRPPPAPPAPRAPAAPCTVTRHGYMKLVEISHLSAGPEAAPADVAARSLGAGRSRLRVTHERYSAPAPPHADPSTRAPTAPPLLALPSVENRRSVGGAKT
jgi:hypothetical protein